MRLVVFSLSVTLAGPLLAASPQQAPVFRAGTNLVTVDAYPLKDGKIVEGLTAQDFVVTEDGKPQKVEAFEFIRIEPTPTEAHTDPQTVDESRQRAADPHNRVFVTFLDTHHVRLAGGYYSNRPLINTVDRILAPNDLFGVMTPLMRPQDVAFARKTETIEGELTKFWSWGRRGSLKILPEADLRRMCYQDPPPGALGDLVDPKPVIPVPAEILERSWEEHALRSLQDLSEYLGRVREARSAVIVLTDGWRQFEPDETLVRNLTKTQDKYSAQHIPGIAVGPGAVMAAPGTSSAGQPGGQDEASCMNEMTRLARLDDRRLLRDVINTANRNNVTFYTVNPDGLIVFDGMMGDPTDMALTLAPQPTSASQAQQVADQVNADLNNQTNRVNGMIELATNTNGIAVVNTNDIATGLKKVVDEVSAYYLLGYRSTNTAMDSAFRHIDVKVARPNIRVAARRGYRAEAVATPKGSVALTAGSAMVESAFSSLSRIPADADLRVTGVGAADGLAVVAEIASRLSSEWSTGGDVAVTVTSAAGEKLATTAGKIEPGARAVLVKVPLATPSVGPWRVQAVVKGGAGTLDAAAQVSASTGALVGDPVVYRGAPGARSAIRPVADMQFYRTERMHIEFPELKPLDQRTARLVGRNGQPLAVAVNLTERDQDGHPVLAADLLLGPLAPADYVVEVTVGAGTIIETKVVGFHVH